VDDRGITDQYFGGDREMRPKQEILFGVGSCRAIEVLGLEEPSIFPG
jgi:glucan phosphorylase